MFTSGGSPFILGLRGRACFARPRASPGMAGAAFPILSQDSVRIQAEASEHPPRRSPESRICTAVDRDAAPRQNDLRQWGVNENHPLQRGPGGDVAKWFKAEDCKSSIRGFESRRLLHFFYRKLNNLNTPGTGDGSRVPRLKAGGGLSMGQKGAGYLHSTYIDGCRDSQSGGHPYTCRRWPSD